VEIVPSTSDLFWRGTDFFSARPDKEWSRPRHWAAKLPQSCLQLQRPADVEGQRLSTLRFGDPRVQALFAVLVIFSLQPQGFRNKELRHYF
jgi:hypothetical protein